MVAGSGAAVAMTTQRFPPPPHRLPEAQAGAVAGAAWAVVVFGVGTLSAQMRLDVLVSVSTACHTRGLPPGRDSAQTRRLLLVRCSVLPLNVRNTWPVVVSAPALDPHLPSPGLLALLRGRQPGGTSRCVFVDRNVSVREVVCDQVTPDVQEASSSPPTPKAGSAIFRYKPRAGHVAHTWCAVTWRMRGAPSRGACVVRRHSRTDVIVHFLCARPTRSRLRAGARGGPIAALRTQLRYAHCSVRKPGWRRDRARACDPQLPPGRHAPRQ